MQAHVAESASHLGLAAYAFTPTGSSSTVKESTRPRMSVHESWRISLSQLTGLF